MKILGFAVMVIFLLGISNSVLIYAGEGHDAGYEWAETHDITDVDYDQGNSESFNEAVRQYAEEQQEASAEYESNSYETY